MSYEQCQAYRHVSTMDVSFSAVAVVRPTWWWSLAPNDSSQSAPNFLNGAFYERFCYVFWVSHVASLMQKMAKLESSCSGFLPSLGLKSIFFLRKSLYSMGLTVWHAKKWMLTSGSSCMCVPYMELHELPITIFSFLFVRIITSFFQIVPCIIQY